MAVLALVTTPVPASATPDLAETDAVAGWSITLTEDGHGAGLQWSGQIEPTGVVRVDGAPEASVDVRFDLGALGGDGYRTDLARIEVVLVDGPGRLTIDTLAPHGRRAIVVDGRQWDAERAPAVMALQLGRETTQRWSFDRPGSYEIALRATVAAAGSGVVSTPSVASDPSDEPLIIADLRAAVSSVTAPLRAASTRTVGTGQRVVIADGHVDVGPRIVDGHWRVQLKDDTVTPLQWRDLVDVVLHATDASLTQVPDSGAYAFLGPPGSSVHLLPQTQRAGIVWPGWNSQDVSVVESVPGNVTWRLGSFEGPGRFVLFLADAFGETQVLFDSGSALPQDLVIARNSHVHGNWAFTAPGVYRIGVEMRATLQSGAPVTDSRILTVVVGDGTDPASVSPTDPGGQGQPVGPQPAESGPSVQVSTALGVDGEAPAGPGGPAPEGPGALVATGSNIVRWVPWALALMVVGLGLHLATRRN